MKMTFSGGGLASGLAASPDQTLLVFDKYPLFPLSPPGPATSGSRPGPPGRGRFYRKAGGVVRWSVPGGRFMAPPPGRSFSYQGFLSYCSCSFT